MPSFVDVRHDVWIHAPGDRVREHYADPAHRAGVTPMRGLSWRCLPPEARGRLLIEHVGGRVGHRRREVFERRMPADGSILDIAVEGAGRGGTANVAFQRETRVGLPGTLVMIDLRVPLPLLLGPLLRPLVAARLARQMEAAVARDKADLESGRGVSAAWEDPRMAA